MLGEYKRGDIVIYQTWRKWWVGVIIELSEFQNQVVVQWYQNSSNSFFPPEDVPMTPRLVNIGSLPEGSEWDV